MSAGVFVGGPLDGQMREVGDAKFHEIFQPKGAIATPLDGPILVDPFRPFVFGRYERNASGAYVWKGWSDER